MDEGIEEEEEQGENFEETDTNKVSDEEVPKDVMSAIEKELGRIDQLNREDDSDNHKGSQQLNESLTEQHHVGFDQNSGNSFPNIGDGYGLNFGLSHSSDHDSFDISPASDGLEMSAPRVSRRPKTLMELYNTYPEIGRDGSTYMQINRESPKRWGNVPIAGFLCDLHQQLSMNEFASKFGGGKYKIHVMGPSPTSRLDDNGQLIVKTLSTFELELPGQPKIVTPTSNEEEEPMGWGRQATGIPYDPQVELKKLDLTAQERARFEQERSNIYSRLASTRGIDPEIVSQIREVSEKRADEARQANLAQIEELRTSNRRKDERLEEKDAEIQRLREKILQIQQETALHMKQEESEEIKRLKEHHKDEISRMNAEHSRTVERLSQEHKDMLAETNRRHADERRQAESQQQNERERLRDDFARREKQMSEDARREKEHMIQMYESRIQSLERANQREVDAVKDQRDREVANIRQSADGNKTITETASNMQISLLQQQVASLKAELKSADAELNDMRSKLVKTPVEAIREAHELAGMTGFGSSKDEGDVDWKQGLFQVAKAMVDKVPEAARQFGEIRESNRMKAQAANQMAIQSQRASMRPQPQMQMYQPPMMSSGNVPQPPWSYAPGPPEPGAAMNLPPANQGPVSSREQYRPAARIGESQQPVKSAAVPVSGQSMGQESSTPFGFTNEGFAVRRQQMQTEVNTQQQNGSVQQQSQQSHFVVNQNNQDQGHVQEQPRSVSANSINASQNNLSGGFQPRFHPQREPVEQKPEITATPEKPQSIVVNGVEIGLDHIDQFVSSLDEYIRGGVVEPEQFAEGLLEQVGKDKAKAIIAAFPVEKLLMQLENNELTAHTSLVTDRGKEYTRKVWEHISNSFNQ